MSRLKISNNVQLAELTSSLAVNAARNHHRGLLLLLDAPAGFLQQYAQLQSAQFIASTTVSDRSDRINTFLGREFQQLVHELNEVLDPGLIAALSGTVVAGGVLVLGRPKSRDDGPPSRFMQRFTRLLQAISTSNPDTVQIAQWASLNDKYVRPSEQATKEIRQAGTASAADSSKNQLFQQKYKPDHWHSEVAQSEQNLLYKQSCQYLISTDRGAVIITGRRGRGKTTLLARIATWLSSREIAFHSTSSQQTALQSFSRFELDPNQSYLPPQKAKNGSAEILLVDEAGSLPLNLLASYLKHYAHVVFCTTIEGYESSGRAFALRFTKTITNNYPDALQISPQQAWRWSTGDALEALLDQWLLLSGNIEGDQSLATQILTVEDSLNASDATGRQATSAIAHDVLASYTQGLLSCVSVTQVDQETLAHNEALLQAVFDLLRRTHYQTTALDLQHLLDSERTEIWVAQSSGKVTGVLLLALEGSIDTELHEAIISKQRRLTHQLLPQLLAQSANQAKALTAHYARVVRISVETTARRQGIGSRMLQAVEAHHMQPSGTLGASFASDASSVAFWGANGYSAFHKGFRRNPRTGTQALAVLKTNDTAVSDVLNIARRIHTDNLASDRTNVPKTAALTEQDPALLKRFVKGHRSAHDTRAALARLAHLCQRAAFIEPGQAQHANDAQLRSLVEKYL